MKASTHPKLLSETAYERLLECLFSKELPVGTRVSQNVLAEMTNLQVGPIRDALKVLEADGIVTVHPRSGIEVIKPSAELIRNVFQFRTIIERAGVCQFALHSSPDLLDSLEREHDALEARLRTVTDTDVLIPMMDQLENHFHLAIVGSLNNEIVDTSFRRIRLIVQVIKLSKFLSPMLMRKSIDEHRLILEACRNRDPGRAEEMISQHLLNALSRNLGMG